MRSIRIAVVMTLALAAPAALAQGRGWVPHQGLHAHVELGPAFLSSSTSDETPSATLSGGGASFVASLGGSIAPGLILGGEVFDVAAADPDLDVEGYGTFGSSGSLGLFGIGPNLTLYLAPHAANVFFAATPAITWVHSDTSGAPYDYGIDTRAGLGLRLAVGKEWFIARSPWGLGVSAHMLVSSNKETGAYHTTWGTYALGVNFSASFN